MANNSSNLLAAGSNLSRQPVLPKPTAWPRYWVRESARGAESSRLLAQCRRMICDVEICDCEFQFAAFVPRARKFIKRLSRQFDDISMRTGKI